MVLKVTEEKRQLLTKANKTRQRVRGRNETWSTGFWLQYDRQSPWCFSLPDPSDGPPVAAAKLLLAETMSTPPPPLFLSLPLPRKFLTSPVSLWGMQFLAVTLVDLLLSCGCAWIIQVLRRGFLMVTEQGSLTPQRSAQTGPSPVDRLLGSLYYGVGRVKKPRQGLSNTSIPILGSTC